MNLGNEERVDLAAATSNGAEDDPARLWRVARAYLAEMGVDLGDGPRDVDGLRVAATKTRTTGGYALGLRVEVDDEVLAELPRTAPPAPESRLSDPGVCDGLLAYLEGASAPAGRTAVANVRDEIAALRRDAANLRSELEAARSEAAGERARAERYRAALSPPVHGTAVLTWRLGDRRYGCLVAPVHAPAEAALASAPAPEEPPADPLRYLREAAPLTVAAIEAAARKRGISVNDVTDAMLDEDRPERLARAAGEMAVTDGADGDCPACGLTPPVHRPGCSRGPR